MNDQRLVLDGSDALSKFEHPDFTAKGEVRASVPLIGLTTLWFNTGTLCNIQCLNCYIESSPTNDQLVYLTAAEVEGYLAELDDLNWPTTEIGFTGGEPFMNPQFPDMIAACLERGYRVLILTNAMRPMMRPRIRSKLLELLEEFPGLMTFRISIDHHREDMHDSVRGKGAFAVALNGMRWLHDNGFTMAVAGRTLWDDSEAESRAGYGAFYRAHGFDIDPDDPMQTVLFPEMDETVDVPEITTACWGILKKTPAEVMCSNARMVVKRKGAEAPAVLACTLLAYDPQFEMGETLSAAARPVKLNHPHCAKFCVLGGASCSG